MHTELRAQSTGMRPLGLGQSENSLQAQQRTSVFRHQRASLNNPEERPSADADELLELFTSLDWCGLSYRWGCSL